MLVGRHRHHKSRRRRNEAFFCCRFYRRNNYGFRKSNRVTWSDSVCSFESTSFNNHLVNEGETCALVWCSLFLNLAAISWDSGQQLEELTAARRPYYFNADWDTTTGAIKAVDARSTKKGPEPEAVAVGKAYGKTWIAVGMERDGGIALYDASNPLAPEFVDYINTSEPIGNLLKGNAGDVSPEGILFVSEAESPTGAALVVVSFELSGTVAIYEIPRKTPSKLSRISTKVEAGKVKLSFKKPATAGWNSELTYHLKCSSSRGALVASSTTNKLVATVPTTLRGVTATCEVFAKTSLGRGALSNKFEVKLK
jgi:hypothetical protein